MLHTLMARLRIAPQRLFEQEQRRNTNLYSKLLVSAKGFLHEARHVLARDTQRIPSALRYRLREEKYSLEQSIAPLSSALNHVREREETRLAHYEQSIRLAHPDTILRRGFSIISSQGKILTSASAITPESPLELRFHDGTVMATATERK